MDMFLLLRGWHFLPLEPTLPRWPATANTPGGYWSTTAVAVTYNAIRGAASQDRYGTKRFRYATNRLEHCDYRRLARFGGVAGSLYDSGAPLALQGSTPQASVDEDSAPEHSPAIRPGPMGIFRGRHLRHHELWSE